MATGATDVIGHGVDIVPVARISELLTNHGERFLARIFRPGEIARARGQRREAERLAARFAAKEAAAKALGTGFTAGVVMRDIEVVNLPSGAPALLLHGQAAELALAMGVREWVVSLSDCAEHAIASVIALGRRRAPSPGRAPKPARGPAPASGAKSPAPPRRRGARAAAAPATASARSPRRTRRRR